MSAPTADEQLASLRDEIDTIDRVLLETLARRRGVVSRMRDAKAAFALPRIDAARESAVRGRWLSVARERELPDALALALLELVLADSRALVAR